jgi:filamentation induced by cAMP protein fic
MKMVGRDKALYIARRMQPEFVFNMAQLEGNPYTFPEVQTTLSGITVGGHKISDQNQVLNIAAGWSAIIRQVATNTFAINKDNFIHINTLIAKDEALSVGNFRDGQVSISGTEYQPPRAGEALEKAFLLLLQHYQQTPDIAMQAFGVFLDAARAQFFYDGNKRTGQLMMNGILLSVGYAPAVIFADAQLEYNQKMLSFYQSGNKDEMISFLRKQYERVLEKFQD